MVDYLANAHTVFLVDDSKNMAPFWEKLMLCVGCCVAAIIDAVEAGYVSEDDYFPYGEGADHDDLREETDEKAYREHAALDLQFFNSGLKLRSITYAGSVLGAFNSMTPSTYHAPLGSRLSQVVAELLPYRTYYCDKDKGPSKPIHIIIPTIGHSTEDPREHVRSLLMALESIGCSEKRINITVYQIGTCDVAAANLDIYGWVYNHGTMRNFDSLNFVSRLMRRGREMGALMPRRSLW